MKPHLALVLAISAALLVACTPKENSSIKVKEVKVVPDRITILEGARESLSVEVVPADAEYLYAEWSSSDESVARINKAGTLTGVKEGTAVVTAAIGEITGTCAVTVVKNATPVTGISLNISSLTMGKGASETLTATVEPANAANKDVDWSSTDNAVATVADGVVTAVGAGECEIIALTVDGGKEARCTVTVTDVPLEALAFSNGSGYTIISDGGSTYTLIVTYTPSNTSERELSWISSDESLAQVEATGEGQAVVTFAQDKTGPVTILANGGTTIRTASQQFFVKGQQEPIVAPEGILYAGRRARWSFNTAAYPAAQNIVWSADGRTWSGPEADISPLAGGMNTVVVSASYGGEPISFSKEVRAEEWFINESIPGANPRNTYPVFNKAATRAYFITRGERRLYEIDLEQGRLGWMFDMNDGKADNGGDICVNPATGDIICSNQLHVFCITAQGDIKWDYLVPSGNSASSIAGCGPAMNNDCSVVFAPLVDNRFLALSAATGEVLDSFDIPTPHIQYAVYGNDDIVIHTQVAEGKGAIRFVRFSAGRFGEITSIDSASNDPTDISAPAISRDQRTAYFPCNKGIMVVVDLQSRSLKCAPKVADGYIQSPIITRDNSWMFFAVQTQTQVGRVDPAGFDSTPTVFFPYTHGQDHYLNFTTVACDTSGNVYFFIKDDGEDNLAFFRLSAASGRWTPEKLATIPRQNPDPQGFFNFGGGVLIGGGGTNTTNRLLVRCIDAERDGGWSGPGGDLCATKNANLVYGN